MSQKDSLGKATDIGLLMFTGCYSIVWSIVGKAGIKVRGNNWQYI